MHQELEESLSEILKKHGYFNKAGNLRPQFVIREEIERIAQAMAKPVNREDPPLTKHQIRRFFQHCRAIEARLRAASSTWEVEEAAFRQLDVAAADAFGKSPRKIPELFHNFIKSNVAAVKTEQDFLKGFLPHFEALVGFGSQFFKERERN